MLYPVLWAIGHLPYFLLPVISWILCLFVLLFDYKHPRIVWINLKLCYPQVSKTRRFLWLIKNHYQMLLSSLLLLRCSFLERSKIVDSVSIEGFQAIIELLEQDIPVIIVGYHHFWLDIFLIALSAKLPLAVTYRVNRNKSLEKLFLNNRSKNAKMVSSRDAKSIVKILQHKPRTLVWHTTDQDIGGKSSVFADFCRNRASTHNSIPRFAKLAGAYLTCFQIIRRGGKFYAIIEKPYKPIGNITADIELINHKITQYIDEDPTQYLWAHKRFKTQQDNNRNPYE